MKIFRFSKIFAHNNAHSWLVLAQTQDDATQLMQKTFGTLITDQLEVEEVPLEEGILCSELRRYA